MISTDDGKVFLCDTKQPGSTLFTIHAHESGVPSIALSAFVPGCLVTGSVDGSVKLWDIKDNKPVHLLTRDMKMVRPSLPQFL